MTSFASKCLATLYASTASEYLVQIANFAHAYDFPFVSAVVITDHSPTLTEFTGITNVPNQYLNEFNNLDHGALDPVSQHCKEFATPIVWDSRTYIEKGCSCMWELQAAHGLKEGISAALHLPHGKHFFFGVDGDRSLKSNPKSLQGVLKDFQLYMPYAQAAAFEIVNGDSTKSLTHQGLSRRELDALKYTMDGYAPADIAKAIGTSERAVELRITKAMHNLDCATKYQAVLKAIRLGYIDC